MVQTLGRALTFNKFQRTYRIEITGQDGVVYTIGDTGNGNPLLTLEFSVNRAVGATHQTGSFRIKNLNDRIRNAIYKDSQDTLPKFPRVLKVFAGYVGSPLATIFDGLAYTVSSQRPEGSTDWITEIEGNDFSTFLYPSTYTNVTLSNPSGVTQQQILTQLVSDFQEKSRSAGVPFNGSFISPNYRQIYGPKVSLSGWTIDYLNTYTDKTAFMDSGKIYCLLNNETISGSVTLISSETGLLGTPRKFDTRLIVDMIFEPGLIPSQQVFLDTTTVNGFSRLNSEDNKTYKVVGINHSGVISSSENGKCKTTAVLLLTVDQLNASFNNVLAPNPVFNGN